MFTGQAEQWHNFIQRPRIMQINLGQPVPGADVSRCRLQSSHLALENSTTKVISMAYFKAITLKIIQNSFQNDFNVRYLIRVPFVLPSESLTQFKSGSGSCSRQCWNQNPFNPRAGSRSSYQRYLWYLTLKLVLGFFFFFF